MSSSPTKLTRNVVNAKENIVLLAIGRREPRPNVFALLARVVPVASTLRQQMKVAIISQNVRGTNNTTKVEVIRD